MKDKLVMIISEGHKFIGKKYSDINMLMDAVLIFEMFTPQGVVISGVYVGEVSFNKDAVIFQVSNSSPYYTHYYQVTSNIKVVQ